MDGYYKVHDFQGTRNMQTWIGGREVFNLNRNESRLKIICKLDIAAYEETLSDSQLKDRHRIAAPWRYGRLQRELYQR